jgi:hypothetical protein
MRRNPINSLSSPEYYDSHVIYADLHIAERNMTIIMSCKYKIVVTYLKMLSGHYSTEEMSEDICPQDEIRTD